MSAARSRTIALLVLLLVFAAACSRAEPTSPTATLGAAPTPAASATPTAPASPDPYAIPADPNDIDAAYVERVIEALNEGVVAATRIVASEQRMNPAIQTALSATHLPSSQQGYLRSFREALRDKKAQQFRTDADSVDVVEVKRVITATRQCVFTLVRQDTSNLSKTAVEPFDVYYHLKAADSPHPQQNPTPWMVAADARPRADGKEFRDPCGDA